MLSGNRLEAALTLLGDEARPATRLPAATVGVAWLDLSFATRRQIPAKTRHRLTVDVGYGAPVLAVGAGRARARSADPGRARELVGGDRAESDPAFDSSNRIVTAVAAATAAESGESPSGEGAERTAVAVPAAGPPRSVTAATVGSTWSTTCS